MGDVRFDVRLAQSKRVPCGRPCEVLEGAMGGWCGGHLDGYDTAEGGGVGVATRSEVYLRSEDGIAVCKVPRKRAEGKRSTASKDEARAVRCISSWLLAMRVSPHDVSPKGNCMRETVCLCNTTLHSGDPSTSLLKFRDLAWICVGSSNAIPCSGPFQPCRPQAACGLSGRQRYRVTNEHMTLTRLDASSD